MNFNRKFVLSVIIIGAVLAAPFFTGRIVINISSSVPLGFWWISDDEFTYGDVVQLPLEAFKFTDWVPEIYRWKDKRGREIPFLKRVAGLPGDLIELSSEGYEIAAGKILNHSVALSTDNIGTKLETYPLPIKLASDEVWLTSDVARGFDSRYLGPARIDKCRKAVLIFTSDLVFENKEQEMKKSQ